MNKRSWPLWVFALAATALQAADLALESPRLGETVSGIGLIRGWACDATTVEVRFDLGERKPLAYGTERADTQSVCGDTDNGFVTQYNFGKLGAGAHVLTLYVDGERVLTRAFEVATLGESYITGLSGSYTLAGFPSADQAVEVTWSEPLQNFVITALFPNDSGSLGLSGLWRITDPGVDAFVSITEEVASGHAPYLSVSFMETVEDSFIVTGGYIENGQAEVTTYYGDLYFSGVVKPVSLNEAEIRVQSCTPSSDCPVSAGDVLHLYREYPRQESFDYPL